MERYVCVHGHFYQPPRENPWLEAIEIQDSAHPYHDWNDRITAECYAPNSAARILDGDRRIIDILSNYARISFNFGPTLLSWMETAAPEVYKAIIDADFQSREWRSGHGNAIAQVYNHIIMPLANHRDKRTQVIWGIRDFESRFKRRPEGMWLAETAVDTETLELLAENGIVFTILAPRQAARVRPVGIEEWQDVSGSRIDPTRAYLCNLPSGRNIHLFFYDGPISQAVAFEKLLTRGEEFASRLMVGFDDSRDWPQILHIATDGETYGHHQKFGDMALAYALHNIDINGPARLTNYGEYLERHPASYEVEIIENSSWSCIHGIERWRSNCGCNSGGFGHWNQEWRTPLRTALDWLRDRSAIVFESKGRELLKDPWQARDEYISVVLDRSEKNINEFFDSHALRPMSGDEKTIALRLLEIQRHAMLMYTSCGWFFDELSGIETVQIMKYAAAVIRLSRGLHDDDLESMFLAKLALARSNIEELRNGANIYENFVRPSVIDLLKVGAHYAVSSLFEEYPDETEIYCYNVRKEDHQIHHAGRTQLAAGRISVTSEITGEHDLISFCVIHFGEHSFNGGVRTFLGNEAYNAMKAEVSMAFETGDFVEIVRLMDKHFGMHNYSLKALFADEQRKILNTVITATIEEYETAYRRMYENSRHVMAFLQETGIPLPRAFLTVAELTLNHDLKRAFSGKRIDTEKIRAMADDIRKWSLGIDAIEVEFKARQRAELMMNDIFKNPFNLSALREIRQVIELLQLLPIEINYWHMQNTYYMTARVAYVGFLMHAKAGDTEAAAWVEEFKGLARNLSFNVQAILPDSSQQSS
jgi:alpha-amylase/alpha-mannosidase (GH57 family)